MHAKGNAHVMLGVAAAAVLWAAPAAAQCGDPPRVAGFEDRRFGAASVKAVQANVAAAFAKSCSEGVIGKEGLGPAVALRNAPEANVATISATGGDKGLVLEYPFVAEGEAQIPPVEEIEEAIFCHVRGASAREQEEEGRCLPD